MSDAILNPDDAAQRARELIEADVNARVEAVRQVVAATNDAHLVRRTVPGVLEPPAHDPPMALVLLLLRSSLRL